MPDTWLGTWQLITSYRDAATDALDSVAEITNAICTDDPIGLALVEQMAGADPKPARRHAPAAPVPTVPRPLAAAGSTSIFAPLMCRHSSAWC
jgi:hypothetical protein